jgi:uncharacterized protein YaaR (DUF327 family)
MAKKISYLDNLQKELGQWKEAVRATGAPKTNKPTGKNESEYKKALGQFGGAIIGRQYSDKTGKRIK